MKEILSESQIYRNLYNYNLTEEVEIATEYFYSEGINEFGIDLLIDDLGLEEFVNFVYDIAEEYVLTEARAGGVKVEPVTKGGKSVASLKGGAKTAAISRLRKQKQAARSGEGSSSGSSGMTAALRSQATKAAASKQKPTRSETPAQAKQGIGAKIGAALKYAGQRAKQDTAKVAGAAGAAAGALAGATKAAYTAGQKFGSSETGQRIKSELAKTAKAAASSAGAGLSHVGSGGSAAGAAGKAAGTFVRKMRAEGYDNFDILLEYLVAEGYADTNKNALAIMTHMSEEWKSSILDEGYVDYRKGKLPSGRTPRTALKSGIERAKVRASREDRATGYSKPSPSFHRSKRASAVGDEMDAHTGIGGKINKALSPGLGNRPGAGPRVAHGEPNTRRHQGARYRRGQSSTSAGNSKSPGGAVRDLPFSKS